MKRWALASAILLSGCGGSAVLDRQREACESLAAKAQETGTADLLLAYAEACDRLADAYALPLSSPGRGGNWAAETPMCPCVGCLEMPFVWMGQLSDAGRAKGYRRRAEEARGRARGLGKGP